MGTFTLNNYKNLDESIVRETYFPPIDLTDAKYEVGVLSVDTAFTIPNVSEKLKNNTFNYTKDDKDISIVFDDGNYSVNHIKQKLKNEIGDGFILNPNKNTSKCEIKSIYPIDFTTDNTIGSLLGFNKRILEPNNLHKADKTTNIFYVDYILINSNMTSGWRVGSHETTVIYKIPIKVNPGYRITEEPTSVRYYPIIDNGMKNKFEFILTDQNFNLIDFRREPITVTIHIRKII